jgi:hypothetical protein
MVIDPQPPVVFGQELHWKAETSATLPPQDDLAQALSIVEQAFLRIAQGIVGSWGSPKFDDYMQKLLIDERGDRKGFPSEVAEALLRLSRMHAERYGFGSKNDVWVDDETRAKRP